MIRTIIQNSDLNLAHGEQPMATITTLPPSVSRDTLDNIESTRDSSPVESYTSTDRSDKDLNPSGHFVQVDARERESWQSLLIGTSFLLTSEVSTAYLLAYQSQTTISQRYILASGPHTLQLFANFVRKRFPEMTPAWVGSISALRLLTSTDSKHPIRNTIRRHNFD